MARPKYTHELEYATYTPTQPHKKTPHSPHNIRHTPKTCGSCNSHIRNAHNTPHKLKPESHTQAVENTSRQKKKSTLSSVQPPLTHAERMQNARMLSQAFSRSNWMRCAALRSLRVRKCLYGMDMFVYAYTFVCVRVVNEWRQSISAFQQHSRAGRARKTKISARTFSASRPHARIHHAHHAICTLGVYPYICAYINMYAPNTTHTKNSHPKNHQTIELYSTTQRRNGQIRTARFRDSGMRKRNEQYIHKLRTQVNYTPLRALRSSGWAVRRCCPCVYASICTQYVYAYVWFASVQHAT